MGLLQHGVLTHRPAGKSDGVDATLTIARSTLNTLFTGATTIEELMKSGLLSIEGDHSKLGELLSLLDAPDPNFAIVVP